MRRGMSWLRTGFRLERWQWILASAVVGAAVAILAVETLSLLGDLLNQGWLRDVDNNVKGSTTSAAGVVAGVASATGGPATRGTPNGVAPDSGTPVSYRDVGPYAIGPQLPRPTPSPREATLSSNFPELGPAQWESGNAPGTPLDPNRR